MPSCRLTAGSCRSRAAGGSISNTRWTIHGRVSEELTLTELRPDETYPTLDDDSGVFWYRPDQLNLHLGIRPPSLH
jgi:hypothetical protein